MRDNQGATNRSDKAMAIGGHFYLRLRGRIACWLPQLQCWPERSVRVYSNDSAAGGIRAASPNLKTLQKLTNNPRKPRASAALAIPQPLQPPSNRRRAVVVACTGGSQKHFSPLCGAGATRHGLAQRGVQDAGRMPARNRPVPRLRLQRTGRPRRGH
jgi:hypothetical protein